MPEVWRASGGGAGQKEMKLHPLRVCFCWAVPALILTLHQLDASSRDYVQTTFTLVRARLLGAHRGHVRERPAPPFVRTGRPRRCRTT